ncbi:MFS transporter asaE [Penicillium expansum]|nr:MFS transporter asaE [Penicillium expansum]
MSETCDSSSYSESSLEKGTHPSDRDDSATNPTTKDASPAITSTPKKQGTKAWLSLTAGFMGMFASFGWVNCVAIFKAEYEMNQLRDYSSSQVGWISSVLFFFMLGVSPVAGRLYNGYGPRLPIIIGSFFHVFGLMMTRLSTEYYQFILSQSVCSGIGTSLIITAAMTAPTTYFHDRRALAGGVAIAGSSLGGVNFPIHGEPPAMLNWIFLDHACEFKLKSYLTPLREWGMFIPYVYIVISAIHYGMSVQMGYNLIPILNGVSFFGRIVPQIWARKYWICNIFIIAMIASMIIILGSWLPSHSNAAIIVFTPSRAIGSPAIGGLVKAPRPATAKAVPIRYPISLGGDMVNAIMGPSPIVAPDAKPNRRGDYVYASVFSGVAYAVSNMLPRGPS